MNKISILCLLLPLLILLLMGIRNRLVDPQLFGRMAKGMLYLLFSISALGFMTQVSKTPELALWMLPLLIVLSQNLYAILKD